MKHELSLASRCATSFLVPVAFLVGCGGDLTPSGEMLTKHPWEVTEVAEKAAASADYTVTESPCVVGQTWEFDPEGIYELISGSDACPGGGDEIITGTWRLAASDTKLILTYDAYEGEYAYDVAKLDDDVLVTIHDAGTVEGHSIRTTYEGLE